MRTGLDPSRGESGQVTVPVEGVPAGGPQGGDAEDGEAEECASFRHGVPGDGPGPGREAPFVVSERTQAASPRWDIPKPACPRCMGAGTPAARKMPWYRVRQAPHGPGRHRKETTACLGGRAAPRCHTARPRVSQRARSRKPAPSCPRFCLPPSIPPVRFGHDRSGCAQTPRGWNRISRRRSPGFISPDTAGSPLMVRRVRRTSRSPGISAEPANSSPITGTAILARCPDIWYVAVILPTRPDTPAECTRCGLSSTSDTFRAGIA